jgi:photosystem II stability/assembly factor-like uncharacterized protein
MQKMFNKKLIYLFATIFAIVFVPNISKAAVLLPGNISSCGELTSPGTYTLTQSVSGGSGTCFNIGSDNVTINGGGFTISGTGDTAIDARPRTSYPSGPLTEGADAYTNLIINDLNISGYTTGINASGNADTSGSGQKNGFGGDAGDIAIFYSYIGSITAEGGDSTTQSYGGLGGNLAFTDTNLDISDSTISLLGGTGTTGDNTNGGLDVTYSGTIDYTNTNLSALSFLNENSIEFGVYPGGSWPTAPGNITSCGTLFATTTATFTLTQDILDISGTCFVIAGDNITLDGGGFTISSANASSTDFAITVDNYTNFTLASTTVTDYQNLIRSNYDVTISGENIDLSNQYIEVDELTISYQDSIYYENFSFSDLSNLVINNEVLGTLSAGTTPVENIFPEFELSIVEPDGTDYVHYWTPEVNWGYSNVCEYSWDNWSSTSTADCGLDGSDIGDPGLGTHTLNVRGSTYFESLEDQIEFTRTLPITVTSPVAGATVSDWNPIIDWDPDNTGIITNCYYSYDNFSSTSTANCASGGSDLLPPDIVGTTTLNLKVINSNAEVGLKNVTFTYESAWIAKYAVTDRVSVDMTPDGSKIIASFWGGYVYTSFDGGTSWTVHNSVGARQWTNIAISDDGMVMAASPYGGYIYLSTDGGLTWNAQTQNSMPNSAWNAVSISSDGNKIAATGRIPDGLVWISVDRGVTWYSSGSTAASGRRGIKYSGDGSTIITGPSTGYVEISKNDGASWTSYPATGNRYWDTFGSSYDGQVLLASNMYGGSVLISTDGGANWETKFSVGDMWYNAGDVSNDGSTIVIPNFPSDKLHISRDSGETWTIEQEGKNWYSIASNEDGTKLVAAVNGGYIYIKDSASGSSNDVNIVRISNSDTILKRTWDSLINWGESVTCAYSYDNFVSTTTVNCANNGSDINPPSSQFANILSIVGIDGSDNESIDNISFEYEALTERSEYDDSWMDINVNSDSTKLVAVGYNSGYPHVSVDGGLTWSRRTGAGARNWQASVISGDGSNILIFPNASYIYKSTNYGTSWSTISSAGSRNWREAVISSNGQTLVAGVYGGRLYKSTNSGDSWSEITVSPVNVNKNWGAMAASDDLGVIVAGVYNERLYKSTDYGATWSQIATAPVNVNKAWHSIAMSSDGQKAIAAVYNNRLYKSSDAGSNWTEIAVSPVNANILWRSVSMSSDGNKIVAVATSNNIYVSEDFGETWEVKGSSQNRWASAVSKDGEVIFSGVYGGKISTVDNYPNILSPTTDESLDSWSPSVDWDRSYICEYSYDNTNWETASCTGDGSDIDAPSDSGYKTLYVRGYDFKDTIATSIVSFTYFAELGNSISSCGIITTSGTYTLTGNINNVSGTCFVVNADDVTINGSGYTITASGGNTSYAVTAGSYSNLTLENINFSGFGGGFVSSNSSITYSGTDVNISNSTTTVGSLTINYTSTLTAIETWFSNLTSLVINNINLLSFVAGPVSWGEQTISACGTISTPGLYTLTQNITDVSGTCFTLETGLVILDGGGFTISGANGNTDFMIMATSTDAKGYSNIAIKDLTVTGFGGVINTSGADGVSGDVDGKNGGNVSLYSVTFPSDILSVQTSGGDGYYEGTTAIGGNAGDIKIVDSTIGQIIANGGDTNGDLNIGYDNGSVDGGLAGTVTNTNSTIDEIIASQGVGYIFGCADSGFPNYNVDATYDSNPTSCTSFGETTLQTYIRALSVSGNGDYVFAGYSSGGMSSGPIYKSSNNGATWSESSGNYAAYGIGSSHDGKYVLVANPAGYVALSDDYGETYSDVTSIGYSDWRDAAVSFTGQYMAVNARSDGSIWLSSDYGANWTETTNAGTGAWFGVSMSANGKYLVATQYWGGVYVSDDYGATWSDVSPVGNAGDAYWSVEMSADGQKIALVSYNSNVYTTDDFGQTWDTYTPGNASSLRTLDMSIDGSIIIVGDMGNAGWHISEDFGISWDSYYESDKYSYAVGVSDDGGKFYADAFYEASLGWNVGYLYTYTKSPRLNVTLANPLSGTIYQFEPMVDWSSAVTCEYSYDNSNWTEVDCDDNGSDIPLPPDFNSNTLYIKGTDASSNIDTDQVTFDLEPYYFCGADSDWLNTSNWFSDSGCSSPFEVPNMTGNVVFVVGTVSPIINALTPVIPNNINTSGMTGPAADVGIIFSDSVVYSGNITGNATFNDSSYNTGTINGNATLNTDYYSGYVQTGSTVTISSGKVWEGEVSGNVYNSDSTEITNWTFTGTGSNQGIINGDATFTGTAFQIGEVNGTATLSGLSQIVQGINSVINFFKDLNSGRDTLYFTSGSTLDVSGLFTLLGLDANNLLSVRSTVPGSYANIGINGTLNFDFLRLKDIRNTGTLVDLSTKTVFDDGHNSGFTFPSNSTPGSRGGVTGEYTAPSLPPSRGGESPGGSTGGETPSNNGGGGNNNSSTGLINNLANPNIDPIDFAPIQQFNPLGENFNPINIGATVIPDPFLGFNPPGQIEFVQFPTNFMPNISSFLFAPIPSTITDALANSPRLQSYMGSVGLSTEQDLASLTANPEQLETPDEENLPPGLFVIKSGNNILTSYATYDQASGGLAQLVKVSPSQSLSISLVPLSTGEVTAEYLGQTITFQSSGNLSIAYITSSNNAGRYVLKTASSPIPLLIEVEVPTEQAPTKKPWGIFYFIWKLLFE